MSNLPVLATCEFYGKSVDELFEEIKALELEYSEEGLHEQ